MLLCGALLLICIRGKVIQSDIGASEMREEMANELSKRKPSIGTRYFFLLSNERFPFPQKWDLFSFSHKFGNAAAVWRRHRRRLDERKVLHGSKRIGERSSSEDKIKSTKLKVNRRHRSEEKYFSS